MNDNRENIGIVGRWTSVVLDPDGNVKIEDKGKNTIQDAFKYHVARIIRDDDGSGSEYNSSALKIQSKVPAQYLSADLNGTASYSPANEVFGVRFKDSNSKYGIGMSMDDVSIDTSNKKISITSKITGTPDNTTWDVADLYIIEGFVHTNAGTIDAGSMHVATADVNATVDQYDTFVITWELTLQDG